MSRRGLHTPAPPRDILLRERGRGFRPIFTMLCQAGIKREILGGEIPQERLGIRRKRCAAGGRDIEARQGDFAIQPLFEEMHEGVDILIAEQPVNALPVLATQEARL